MSRADRAKMIGNLGVSGVRSGLVPAGSSCSRSWSRRASKPPKRPIERLKHPARAWLVPPRYSLIDLVDISLDGVTEGQAATLPNPTDITWSWGALSNCLYGAARQHPALMQLLKYGTAWLRQKREWRSLTTCEAWKSQWHGGYHPAIVKKQTCHERSLERRRL